MTGEEGSDGQLIVRPFHRVQRGTQSLYFFAPVERFRSHQQVLNIAGLETTHIIAREVVPPVHKTPE